MADTEIKQGMLCPVCRIDLMMSDRQGIEIDYCPRCRGVWLDRGELDKILERSAAAESPEPARAPHQQVRAGDDRRYEDRRHEEQRYRDDRDDKRQHHGRRRKSWLGDMFEFGD